MPVYGFADLHCHPMAHRGFGGVMFSGEPEGPPDVALARCDQGPRALHGLFGTGLFSPSSSLFTATLEGTFGHGACGFPSFSAWPRYDTRIHQQMFVDWVKRAYDGGLRLMCSVAVNNELLARELNANRPHDDQNAIDAQVQGMRQLVAHQSGWMGIASNPTEARALINAGRLAVVLGIEVDSLDGVKRPPGAPLDQAAIDAIVDWLKVDLGIGLVTPVHLADNAFGGTAVYGDLFSTLNCFLRGQYYEVTTAPPDVEFQLGHLDTLQKKAAIALWNTTHQGNQYPQGKYQAVPGGHANTLGLTGTGQHFLKALMRAGILIDVDHMGDFTAEGALTLLETYDYPAISSHCAFRELGFKRSETGLSERCAHEGMRSRAHAQRVLNSGGLLAPITMQGEVKTWPTCKVLNNCANSAKTWAQAYQYAVDLQRATGKGGVALGSDFNGLATQPGPRFGPDAAALLEHDPLRKQHREGQLKMQQREGRLPYTGTMLGTGAPFVASKCGDRTFDVNTDGLAHYGMLPDFLREVGHCGLPLNDFHPLFNSAEAFIAAWEKAQSRSSVVPP